MKKLAILIDLLLCLFLGVLIGVTFTNTKELIQNKKEIVLKQNSLAIQIIQLRKEVDQNKQDIEQFKFYFREAE